MHQGNWSCSSCKGSITELPFEPRSTTNLLCKNCHSKQRGTNGGGGAAKPMGDRKMFAGAWECSGCNAPITSLPFEPKNTSNLLCKDCFKKRG